MLTTKNLTRGRTDNVRSNILADHEFSADCYIYRFKFKSAF